VDALNREISDHTPLLLSLGEKAKAKKSAPFKFKLSWLLKEGFFMWSLRFGGRRVVALPQCKYGVDGRLSYQRSYGFASG
jgi:hypothetical protein